MSEKKVKIDKIVCDGYGLGFLDGKAIFVPYSVPGDVVEVENVSRRKGVEWGSILQIVEASPNRVEPFCSHYSTCGGCDWQHIEYSCQLEYKRSIVEDTLERIGGLSDVCVKPCIPSPIQKAYRRRVKLHRDGKNLGFYKQRSNVVVPIETCPILSDEINLCLKQLSSYTAEHGVPEFKDVEFIQGSEAGVVMTLLSRKLGGHSLSADDIPACSGASVFAGRRVESLWGKDYVEISLGGLVFRFASESFFQANTALLPELVRCVTGAVEKCRAGLELYAGVCVFGSLLSEKVDVLTAVEWNRRAVDAALINLRSNNIDNTAVYRLSVERGLDLAAAKKPMPDFVLLDPPREGVSKDAYKGIEKLSPRQIVYVSCNPATLARDIKKFISSGNYSLQYVQPLDMFPHTSHVESVAVLSVA